MTALRPTRGIPGQRPTASRPPTEAPTASGRGGAALVRVRALFAAEGRDYFQLLGVTLFLVAFGLVMVLSSSMIVDYTRTGDFFGSFMKQAFYALVGVPAMLLASRIPAAFYRKWTPIALIAILLVQGITGLAGSGDYNRSWLSVGGIQFQPAEFVKLFVVLTLALALTRDLDALSSGKKVLLRVAPVTVLAILLVMTGNDLGTSMVLFATAFGVMFFAGVRARHLVMGAVGSAALIAFFAAVGSSRMERINVWLSGACANPTAEQALNFCYQPLQGTWALAAGGVFGQGLGNSQAKWSFLPESDNDYVFAIIGEELGLIGCVLVLVLLLVLAWSFVRIIRGCPDPFGRAVVGGIMVWLLTQAFMNIGVVLGVFPVLGVPLPFISAGGSAMISSLCAVGVALSFARRRRNPGVEVPA